MRTEKFRTDFTISELTFLRYLCSVWTIAYCMKLTKVRFTLVNKELLIRDENSKSEPILQFSTLLSYVHLTIIPSLNYPPWVLTSANHLMVINHRNFLWLRTLFTSILEPFSDPIFSSETWRVFLDQNTL